MFSYIHKIFVFRSQKGQVMLLTVVLLSGVILGTTAISGILMLNQVRQATNATDSQKAIFAADTGIEWELYKRFKDKNYPQPILGNGAIFETASTTGRIKSTGYSDSRRRVARAFQVDL
jgi:hypothetical protein